MSCSPFDLRDYLLGELAESQRRQVELHARSCGGCHEELERLRITHATLLALRDEEIRQRIGFVSDKVFDPSPWRRSWEAFWGSAARLGFSSAVILSAALVIFTLFGRARTPALPAGPMMDTARIEAEVARRVDVAVEKAVAESEARQARQTSQLVEAAQRRFEQQLKSGMERVSDEYAYLRKSYNVMLLASNETGGVK
jgi:hypothetical protein